MKEPNNDINLITRILTGEASEEERNALLDWIDENKSNMKLFFEMKDIWEVSHASTDSRFNSDISWKKFKNQIESKEEEEEKERRRQIFRSFLKMASIVIVSIGLSWLTFSLTTVKKPITAKNEVITPIGSKTQIVLPDGTKVWLNSGSNLTYYSDYNGQSRDVVLSGEAFFEVVKNPKRPFVVKTGKIDIKAYGTAFNVKSYPSDLFIETTLINGEVTIEKVATKKTLAVLKPNQKAIYYKEDIGAKLNTILKLAKQKISKDSIIEINANENIILAQTNTEPETVWKDQKLYFTSETFDEIATKLERWYGVKIHLQSDNILNERFTGKFTHNESLVQVLEVMKITTPITYSVKLNDIYINIRK